MYGYVSHCSIMMVLIGGFIHWGHHWSSWCEMHSLPLNSLKCSRHSLLVTLHRSYWYICTNGKKKKWKKNVVRLRTCHIPVSHNTKSERVLKTQIIPHSETLWSTADSFHFETPFLAVNVCKWHLFFPPLLHGYLCSAVEKPDWWKCGRVVGQSESDRTRCPSVEPVELHSAVGDEWWHTEVFYLLTFGYGLSTFLDTMANQTK